MKNLSRLMFLMLLTLGYNSIEAQDKLNPWQITIGINAVDEYPSADGGVFSKVIFDEIGNVEDHWNIMPSLSSLAISKYLRDGFSFGLTGSLNQIEKRGNKTDGSGKPNKLVNELTYYAIDGTIKFNFLEAGKTLDPYIGVGGGYTWIEKVEGSSLSGEGPTVNGSLGLNIWFSQSLGLTIQSSYKHAFGDKTTENDLNTHLIHSAGFSIKFGGVDTDGDGILDKRDACPELPGVEAFKGCPDTDGDGIQDSKDACPDVAGLAELDGCPDTDGDGITDEEDDCPEVAGLAELDGCPDTDGDGVIDQDDNCPDVAGLAALAGCPDADGDGVTDGDDECADVAGPSENKGCPWPDTDGDSVLDKDDKCVDVKGTVANEGCPEVTVEIQKTLNEYAKTILFETGNSNIKKQSEQVLADIIKILNEYKNAKFTIEGHTDSIGKASSNQKLSDSRANSVKQYLVDSGIDAFRLSALGYGESKPIDSNKTKAGRANNRRVEINLAN